MLVMSWVVEMRPQPMDATLIRLLGAFFPNTLAGTMDGKLSAREVPRTVFAVLLRNSLRLVVDCLLFDPDDEIFFFMFDNFNR